MLGRLHLELSIMQYYSTRLLESRLLNHIFRFEKHLHTGYRIAKLVRIHYS